MIYIILGTQWGDEGKAKVIDYFARDFDYVVRFQGGANAGHTVYVGEKKYVFHLIPSGILNPNARVVIGNGLVLDVAEFLNELGSVSRDVDVKGRVFVSNRAHVVLPYHKLMDKAKETMCGNPIGTTMRGIGPAYVDKADRIGLRVGDLVSLDRSALLEKVKAGYEVKKFLFENYYHLTDLPTPEQMTDELVRLGEQIAPYVTDTEVLLQKAHAGRSNIMFEGAQGSLLDVDFGTYPFVTSSNTIASGAINGSGIGALDVANVVGITKAYVTRVGQGPFPTEQDNEVGEYLRKQGNEYGATTGRKRRCGWFDLVAGRFSIGVNGVREIFLTKLDVLDGVETIKVCTHYELVKDGKSVITGSFPSSIDDFEFIRPVYQDFPGWKERTFGAKKLEQLPVNARRYVEYLEVQLERKISYISTGFERDDVIVR